jgi:hypothetical protein
MKILAIIAVVLVLLYVGYRFLLPAAFVAVGRGAVSEETVSVASVSLDDFAVDESGERVDADPGMKFVNLDLDVDGTYSDVDVYDFQLVKEKAPRLGSEENIGDNFADKYFYWTALDEQGQPVELTDYEAKPIRLRLAFHVPQAAENGYLFYWGEYFGPFDLGS